MPEIKIDEILGEEEERRELEGSELPLMADPATTTDPFAAAIVHQAAVYSPEVAQEISAYLKVQTQHVAAQSQHVHIQTKLLKDEHDLRLAHLRNQLREEKLRRIGIRLRVSFQVFLACVATLIGITGLFMLHDAFLSRSVVIEAFEIAPNLADRVPSGKVVATGMFDVLSHIQAATRTNAERRALSNAWTNDIAIDVPETGMSVGQIERTLKARFGHDQHINGDLTQTETGALALTVRGNGILARTFTDPSNSLERLLVLAGEYVYGQSQPGLWTNYLTNAGRNDDAIQFAKSAYSNVETSEKPYVLNYWGNAIVGKGGAGAMHEALSLYRETLRLKPDYWSGYNNIIYALWNLGEEDAAVQEGELMIKMAGGRPGAAPEAMYQNYDQLVWDLTALHVEVLDDMEANGGIGIFAAFAGSANFQVAQTEVLMHDLDSATLRVKTTAVDESNLADVAISALTRALIAEESGDVRQAAREWDQFSDAYQNPSVSTSNAFYMCYAAVSYQKSGQPEKADNVLEAPRKATGIGTFVDCDRFKGDVLDLRGDWPGAEHWYRNAIKLAPSIPSSYYSYGMALLRHGKLDKAAEQFMLANQKGPHWADPLKGWGDVLSAQGHKQEALEKYEAALKYAPKWEALNKAHQALSKT